MRSGCHGRLASHRLSWCSLVWASRCAHAPPNPSPKPSSLVHPPPLAWLSCSPYAPTKSPRRVVRHGYHAAHDGTVPVPYRASHDGTVPVPYRASHDGTVSVPYRASHDGTVSVPYRASLDGTVSVPCSWSADGMPLIACVPLSR